MTSEPRPAQVSPAAVDPHLRRSYEHCRSVARRHARNFYYGLMLTPQPKRGALYAIYGFMRACDDLADEPLEGCGSGARADRVELFRASMVEAAETGRMPEDDAVHAAVWPAFVDVLQNYPVRLEHLHAMLDGQSADLAPCRYETFDQTYGYSYKVAGTVGQVCLSVWGYSGGAATLKLSEQRGVALQLTNILRDLVEDARRDRVYLPTEELERFGYDPALLTQGKGGDAFDALMAFQIERAKSYYEKSATLESHLEPACRPACWAIMKVYHALLEKIAKAPRRVLAERVRLSTASKIRIAASAVGRRWWG